MITVRTLNLEEAKMLIDAAAAKSAEIGCKHVICVADNAGYPIALHRMDGGKVTSVQIAENKAFTAAGHKRKTHTFTNTYPGEEAWGIFTQHYGKFTVFVGGYPIEVNGEVVGGIGVSGGNGEQDTAICEAALAVWEEYVKDKGLA